MKDKKKLRPNIILIGDSIDDASMVDGAGNVLRIIIDNSQGEDVVRDKRFYDEIFQKFDLVIRDRGLYPVVKIINLF